MHVSCPAHFIKPIQQRSAACKLVLTIIESDISGSRASVKNKASTYVGSPCTFLYGCYCIRGGEQRHQQKSECRHDNTVAAAIVAPRDVSLMLGADACWPPCNNGAV